VSIAKLEPILSSLYASRADGRGESHSYILRPTTTRPRNGDDDPDSEQAELLLSKARSESLDAFTRQSEFMGSRSRGKKKLAFSSTITIHLLACMPLAASHMPLAAPCPRFQRILYRYQPSPPWEIA
jgi:hypothetical protein